MFNKFIVVVIVAFAFCVDHLNAASCVSCSSNDEPKCAQHPERIAPKQCTSLGSEVACYVRVINGATLRGCTDEMDQGVREKCNNTLDCATCRDFDGNSGCNQQIFPEKRVTCHICTGELGSNCSKAINHNPTVCQTYVAEDKCFIRKTPNGVERGCFSDSGTKCNNQSHCFICNGHGCNSQDSNNTDVPFAPSSAAMWKYSTTLVTVLIAYTVASFI